MAIARNLILLAALLFGGSAFPSDTPENNAVPVARFEFTDVNFGEVEKGTVVEESIPIENAGSATLRIERVELSNKGMKIGVRQSIEPGATGNARLTWDTAGFAGDAKAQALLFLNDPQRPRVLLTLHGRVVAPVEIVPRPAFYMSQFVGEESSQTVLLRNNREGALEVLGIEPHGRHFDASFEPVKPGRTYRLKVSVPADTAVGRYRESMTVLTDDPDNRNIHVEVNVLVKAPVYANPEAFDFGSISLNALRGNPRILDLSSQTSVIGRQEGEMRITSVETDIPFLETRLQPSGPSNRFRLDVGLDPGPMVPGPFEGHVTLRTDDPRFPLLRLPVSGRITD